MTPIARSELILGGQKSGKSRRAEMLAREWLAQSPAHRAVLIATGQAWDDEMRQRIARHQRERAERVPGMLTLEEPRDLAGVLARVSSPQALVVVDCLTLWLTNWLMPAAQDVHPLPPGEGRGEGRPTIAGRTEYEPNRPPAPDWQAQAALFLEAIRQSSGPVVLVGNEIGLGVIPLGREVRAFVDALGGLNQQVAAACERVTLMAAGLPLTLKTP
ncbi:bifunctional adenosylcobinamide kinase/adenosylcobinamide-phosphate guanylyltransferase [Oryzisolibacter sp. LB2S]|uniref:bifunctional adenosylcobinamide kinase/adenosylcobinamide-phosphate guanylyltransferase n=1 Tax=Alicycliphilus soli TaxID=3228789 RepID=UPI003458D8E8